MAISSKRKSDAARRANQVIRTRTVAVMLLLGIGTFLALFWKLYDLQINQHEAMQERAVNQQTRSAVVTASRGSIYDRNGFALAVSATAETVNISPKEIAQFVENQKTAMETAAQKAREKGESYTAPRLLDQAYIARGLSRILEVDQESIEKKMEKTEYMYAEIKKKTERDVADEVRRFINGEIDEEGNVLTEVNTSGKTVLRSDGKSSPRRLQGVWLQPDSKRYYPYSSLAANVVGFVNGDNVGGVGLESKYESELEGTSGLTITAKNAVGTDLLYQYEQYYDAENGNDLVLTLDVTVQSYLEKGIANMLDRFDAKGGGTGIVMDVNSGAILAMASYPNYDLNQYGTVLDETLRQKLESAQEQIEKDRASYETEEDYEAALSKAYSDAIGTQWRNKCIDSTYEPGSTFKPIIAVASLEEQVIGQYDKIACTGVYDLITPPMRCWIYPGSHGEETITEGIRNSCNFFFAELGHRLATSEKGEYDTELGLQRIRKYAAMFGLDRKSGVEIVENEPMMSTISPEQSAIGQGTNSYANIQLSRYVTTIANRGTVFQLSVLDRITDWQGQPVRTVEPNVSDRISISDSTWNAVQQGMREVVQFGSARRLFTDLEVNIAGKTGTAQESRNRANHAFFISFGPFENPQLAVTINIPYGYTSTNAASVSKDVYRLCFGYTSLDYVLNTGARSASEVKIAD